MRCSPPSGRSRASVTVLRLPGGDEAAKQRFFAKGVFVERLDALPDGRRARARAAGAAGDPGADAVSEAAAGALCRPAPVRPRRRRLVLRPRARGRAPDAEGPRQARSPPWSAPRARASPRWCAPACCRSCARTAGARSSPSPARRRSRAWRRGSPRLAAAARTGLAEARRYRFDAHLARLGLRPRRDRRDPGARGAAPHPGRRPVRGAVPLRRGGARAPSGPPCARRAAPSSSCC